MTSIAVLKDYLGKQSLRPGSHTIAMIDGFENVSGLFLSESELRKSLSTEFKNYKKQPQELKGLKQSFMGKVRKDEINLLLNKKRKLERHKSSSPTSSMEKNTIDTDHSSKLNNAKEPVTRNVKNLKL